MNVHFGTDDFLQKVASVEVGKEVAFIVDGVIDIAPLIEQEIILNIPIKVLCRPDCPGIQDAAGKYNKPEETDASVQTRARRA